MTTPELIDLLQAFYRDKLAIRNRHVAGAAGVAAYDFNNTYQYICNRDDTHLSWVREALVALGADVPADAPVLDVPKGEKNSVEQAIIEHDARSTRAFMERWRARLVSMTHARHRKMLEVVLGEAAEQCRFFEQMLEGRDDLLGRRPPAFSTGGGVLPVRWLE